MKRPSKRYRRVSAKHAANEPGDTSAREPAERRSSGSKRARERDALAHLDVNVVDLPTYQDRTEPIHRVFIIRWLRRWIPILLAALAIIIGPIAGGWYYQYHRSQRAQRQQSQRLMTMLSNEIAENVSRLDQQIGELDAVERALQNGSRASLPSFTTAYPSFRWKAVSGRFELFDDPALFEGLASFYNDMGTLDAALADYGKAAAEWRAKMGAPAPAGETIEGPAASERALLAVRTLRQALAARREAGEALLARLSPAESD